jgi:hypothetical protein
MVELQTQSRIIETRVKYDRVQWCGAVTISLSALEGAPVDCYSTLFARSVTPSSTMRLSNLALAGALLLGLTLPSLSHAQWSWRDASGRLTVSDRPPPSEVPDKSIVSRPAGASRDAAKNRGRVTPSTAVAADANTDKNGRGDKGDNADAPSEAPSSPLKPAPRDAELEARRLKAEQQVAAKNKAIEDKNKEIMRENCDSARRQMAMLESGVRMSRTGANGEREVVDDAARAQEAARTRETMATNCK